jgi:hypothetical protein
MTILFLLLLVAIVPTLYFDWRYVVSDRLMEGGWPDYPLKVHPSIPMHCFYDISTIRRIHSALYDQDYGTIDGGPFVNGLITILFLVGSYSTRVIKLFRTSSAFFNDQVRARSARILKNILCFFVRALDLVTFHAFGAGPWAFLVECPLMAAYVNCRVVVDIYASTLSDIIGLYFGCAIAIHRLFLVKRNESRLKVVELGMDDADDLDFGQLLPLALLIAPVIAFIKPFLGAKSSDLRDHSAHDITPSESSECQESPQSDGTLTTHVILMSPTEKTEDRQTRLRHLLEVTTLREPSWYILTVISILMGMLLFLTSIYLVLVGETDSDSVSRDMMALVTFIMLAIPICMPSLVCAVLVVWQRRGTQWISWAYLAIVATTITWNFYRACVIQLLGLYNFNFLQSRLIFPDE